MAHGQFCWNELIAADVEKAKAFYSEAIGWEWEEMPMENGSYWIAMQDGEQVAGMMPLAALPEGAQPCWFVYLDMDDVDERIEALAELGGKVLRPPFDIPGVGRIAIVADASGTAMGWMTPAEK